MEIINTIETTLNDINGTTWINNVKIEGAQTISINNDKIYVNGKLREDLKSPSIEVKIEGNVASVHTGSGDVTCKDVKGGVLTMSGDVTCGNVGGNIYHN